MSNYMRNNFPEFILYDHGYTHLNYRTNIEDHIFIIHITSEDFFNKGKILFGYMNDDNPPKIISDLIREYGRKNLGRMVAFEYDKPCGIAYDNNTEFKNAFQCIREILNKLKNKETN